jgi:hypothetical protein
VQEVFVITSVWKETERKDDLALSVKPCGKSGHSLAAPSTSPQSKGPEKFLTDKRKQFHVREFV